MENQKSIKTAKAAAVLCQLVVFFFLCSAASMKAQCAPIVAPYPATDLGQTLLINQGNPLYTPMMQTANSTRAAAQAYINNNPCGGPTEWINCYGPNGNLCCETVYKTDIFGNVTYTTTCMYDGKYLCTITQGG
jgi:hypothetical protein